MSKQYKIPIGVPIYRREHNGDWSDDQILTTRAVVLNDDDISYVGVEGSPYLYFGVDDPFWAEFEINIRYVEIIE